MRPRFTFRAAAWEPLEGRELLSAVVFAPQSNRLPSGIVPNLRYYLLQLDEKYAAKPAPTPTPGGKSTGSVPQPPQPQVLVKPSAAPYGYIDPRVTLSRTDVAKLGAAVNSFAGAFTGGQNAAQDGAAVSDFKAKLADLDRLVATEQHIAGGTASFLDPLLTGTTPPTKSDAATLSYVVSTFSTDDTYGADRDRDAVALSALESSLNLMIATHHT